MAGKCEMEPADVKLSEIFDEIWTTYENLETSTEPTNSDSTQLALARVLKKCEAAIEMVNMLALFSTNEDMDEVSTEQIKYMLLSALLGYFTMKKLSSPSTRLAIVNKSKAYYKDYLRLCSQYCLISGDAECTDDYDASLASSSTTTPILTERSSDLHSLASRRAQKIQRFKQSKEDESKLSDLHKAVNREHVDEEVKRDYYIALLRKFIRITQDDLECISTEVEMLDFMAQRTGQPPPPATDAKDKTNKPFRPFILTKNELQKKVFGAGYPSLHTMSIDEFYQQKVKDGTFQQPSRSSLQEWANDPDKRKADDEEEKAREEMKEEKDDEEELRKKRAMDDWKDDHRRGEGNRQNMG